MRPKIRIALLIILCLAPGASGIAANTITGQPQPTPVSESDVPQDSAARGTFAVVLEKSLDSKKLKDGDPVICLTAGTIRLRGLMIPSGARVTAHITRATARSKGDSDSSLSLVFDKIEVAKGKELLMKGTLQAVARSLESFAAYSAHSESLDQAPAGSGAPPMQVASDVSSPRVGPHPLVNSQSMGVLGIRDLEMDKNSVLTSNGKEVKLESGTQMMIRAEIQSPGQF